MFERGWLIHIKLTSLIKVFLSKSYLVEDEIENYHLTEIVFKCFQNKFNKFIEIVFNIQVMTMNYFLGSKFDDYFLLTEISLVLVRFLLTNKPFNLIHDFTGITYNYTLWFLLSLFLNNIFNFHLSWGFLFHGFWIYAKLTNKVLHVGVYKRKLHYIYWQIILMLILIK